MIKTLHIENYALIQRLDISLHTGFSVITGETGAGKSIILGAIGLLLGQRADTKAVKAGEKRCVIEATFDISACGLNHFFDEHDLDFDGTECIVRRELTSAGKSRAFINDTPTQLSLLKELGDKLIDVHSQHQNLLLNKEDFQLNILDIIASNKDLLTRYKSSYAHYKDVRKKLKEAVDEIQKNREDEDYLRFQYGQLAEAELSEGEQESLETEAETLSHAEEIKQGLYRSYGYLSSDSGSDAVQDIKQSVSALQSVSGVFSAAEPLVARLESCYIELKDIAGEIETAADSIEYSPERLSAINERLNTIYSLQQKHHVSTVQELIAIQTELESRIANIDNSDEHIKQLEQECGTARKQATQEALQLSEARQAAAHAVEEEVVARLLPLGMPNVKFKVDIARQSGADGQPELGESGADKVSFLFSANKNGKLENVTHIASGGEIARVMLALKAIIAGAVSLPTIIFDEIDTGVSGRIAEKMACIMKEMGEKNRQVISITHLPQVAALGTSHYKVYKEDTADTTTSHIIELTQQQRVEEIAHMLSGETLTEAAINNAKELLATRRPDA